MKTINPNSVPKIVAMLFDVDGGDDDGEVGGSLVLTMYHIPL